MTIRRLDPTRARDVRAFCEFPFQLYRASELWAPPLVADVRLALDARRHPFYRHSEAAFFLAERDGEVVGRIGVADHRPYNEYLQEKTAFFCFFDAVDDASVAEDLFGAALGWARARGLSDIIGPHGLLASDSLGLLVEGFEHPPALSQAYNYPYYEALVRGAGFEKLTDHVSGYLPGSHTLPPRLIELAERVMQRRGFWIKSFASRRELRQWVMRAAAVVNGAFAEAEGGIRYVPLNEEEVALAQGQIVDVADPRMVKLVMKGDEIAGFIFSYPDLTDGLRRARGRIWPFGWLHLLQARRRTEWANVNGLGLLPEYQGLGANAVLYVGLERALRPFGFKHVEIVQVDEQNPRSIADMETMGVRWYKRHRTFRRTL